VGGVIPDEKVGDFFIPVRVKLGKTRWWREWLREQGKEINKGWKQFLEPKKEGEIEI
jgi:hypothetical protein